MFDINWDNIHDYHRRQDNAMEHLKSEPCMKIPEVGDTVLVNAFVLGMGNESMVKEAVTVAVADGAYRLRFDQSYGEKEKWVKPWVVIDVLGKTD